MFFKRLITAFAIILVVGVAANDIIRFFSAQRALTDATYDLVAYAANNRLSAPRDTVAAELQAMAAQRGVRVTMYGQSAQAAEIWTEMDVDGLLIAGPVYNMVSGKNLQDAMNQPLVIASYRVAGPQ